MRMRRQSSGWLDKKSFNTRSGPGMTDGEDVVIPHGEGSAWSVPLGSTWVVKVDGRHAIGSGDRTDLPLPSSGPRQDLMISLRVAADGTVKLLEACFGGDYVDGRCAPQ